MQQVRQQNYDMAWLIVDEYAKALRRSIQTGSIRPTVNVHQRGLVGTFEDTHEAFWTLEEQYDQLEEQYTQPIRRRANRIEAAPMNDSRPMSDPYRRGQDNAFEHDSNSYNEPPSLNRASTSNQNPTPTPNTPQPTNWRSNAVQEEPPKTMADSKWAAPGAKSVRDALAAGAKANASSADMKPAPQIDLPNDPYGEASTTPDYEYAKAPYPLKLHNVRLFDNTCERYRAIEEEYDQLDAYGAQSVDGSIPTVRSSDNGTHCRTCTCGTSSKPQPGSPASPSPMNLPETGNNEFQQQDVWYSNSPIEGTNSRPNIEILEVPTEVSAEEKERIRAGIRARTDAMLAKMMAGANLNPSSGPGKGHDQANIGIPSVSTESSAEEKERIRVGIRARTDALLAKAMAGAHLNPSSGPEKGQ